MNQAALQLPLESSDPSKGKNIKEEVFGTHTEELIIGLCAPIGTDIHYIASELGQIIKEKYGYEYEVIRLSSLIKQYSRQNLDGYLEGTYEYYNQLIGEGNKLRNKEGSSILAELAIGRIAYDRELNSLKKNTTGFPSNRKCYIIDSLKNNEELDLFRLIYNDIFHFFGVFSIPEVREKNLEKKGLKKDEIHKLFNTDSGEEIAYGQRVSDTFIQSDFFLRIDQNTSSVIINRISRFLSLIFSSEVVTPTHHETAMYLASAAAGNSACLSRQVGAALTDENGEVLSVGWNDVPKVGGGVYQTDENLHADSRCINLDGGLCFNDEEKRIIRNELVKELVDNKIIDKNKAEAAVSIIKKSRIRELIEFSRAVHAEMLAIIHGSQNSGSKVRNGKLYTTTYPCHNCARHIVAAGIKEVYYIEPYRKSLALKLHGDSLTETEGIHGKVQILMFDGVAPRRYLEFFRMIPNSRKENGKMKRSNKKQIFPKKTVSLQAIPILEKKIIDDLKQKNLISVPNENQKSSETSA